jgi:hypothetical protein
MDHARRSSPLFSFCSHKLTRESTVEFRSADRYFAPKRGADPGGSSAKRATVQEAVGRLSELTGARAYGGAIGRVRFRTAEEMKGIGGVGTGGVAL